MIAGAHTNKVAGATSTTLYSWDYLSDSLVAIGSPGGSPSANGGVMTTIGLPPGILTFNAGLGMDISGSTGTLYVTHDDPGSGEFMSLYTRNLLTGAETLIGAYPAGNLFIADIAVAIAVVPEPAPALLGALGLAGLWALHRRRRPVG